MEEWARRIGGSAPKNKIINSGKTACMKAIFYLYWCKRHTHKRHAQLGEHFWTCKNAKELLAPLHSFLAAAFSEEDQGKETCGRIVSFFKRKKTFEKATEFQRRTSNLQTRSLYISSAGQTGTI